MGHFGYRLFVLRLRHDGGRKDVDYKSGNAHFIDSLYPDLRGSIGRHVKLLDPIRYTEESAPLPRTGKVLRFKKVERKNFSLRLEFEFGPYGDEGILIDPDGVDIDLDISGKAVSRSYRAMVSFPEKGSAAILAVEARGRACPYARIPPSYKEIRTVPYDLFISDGLADRAAVSHFIKNGVVKELEVATHGIARDGDVISDRVKMVVKVSGASKVQDTMRAEALKWAGNKWRRLTEDADKMAYAKDLAYAATGVTVPLPFVDTTIRVDGPGDRSKSLKPSNDIGEWIYDVGDIRLSDDKWFEEVSSTVSDLYPVIAESEGVTPPD